jgi:hypothetical protein
MNLCNPCHARKEESVWQQTRKILLYNKLQESARIDDGGSGEQDRGEK